MESPLNLDLAFVSSKTEIKPHKVTKKILRVKYFYDRAYKKHYQKKQKNSDILKYITSHNSYEKKIA